MQVQVEDECVGCGACESLYPGGFEVVEGKSEPRDDLDISMDDAHDAADRCPQGAIQVEEGSPAGGAPGTELSLSEVLERASEAGVEGADTWLERVGGSGGGFSEAGSASTTAEAPGSPASGSASRSMSKSRGGGGSRSASASTGGKKRNIGQMILQIGVVAIIVIASAYLAFG